MPEQPDMDQRYKNVFGSMEGRAVLADILTRGHYGVTLDPDNPVQIAEYNSAVIIAHRAGVFEQVYRQLGITQGE